MRRIPSCSECFQRHYSSDEGKVESFWFGRIALALCKEIVFCLGKRERERRRAL